MKRLVILILIVLFSNPVLAQNEGESSDISPELSVQLDLLEAETSNLRGLVEKEDVIRRFPTRDDLILYLEGLFEEELTDDVLAQEMAFYSAFDFVEPDLDLYATYLELYSEQIAGFYDSETEEMNTILMSGELPGDELPLLERIIYVHEYVHALQDQYFDLESLLGDTDSLSVDEILAVQALIEGDATFIMNLYTVAEAEKNPLGALIEVFSGGLEAGNLTMPPGIPTIIERELLFPYLSGEVFVTAIYADGGVDALNATYANPPVSTEQILHPEKYIDGEMPVSVAIDLTMPEDWELLREDVPGEFYIREYLDIYLPLAQATEAAAGWGGATYQVYGNSDDEQAWILKMVMDSPEDMLEFYEAYLDLLALREDESGEVDGDCASYVAESICIQYEVDTIWITSAPDDELVLKMQENR